MSLRLESIAITRAPVDARHVCQAVFSGMSRREIERISVTVGARQCPLAELFGIHGNAEDHVIEWTGGSLSHVNYIGYGLEGGTVNVQAGAGDFLGSEMRGGTIVVHGDVGQFVGQGMQGGQITLFGHAGDYAGGASAVGRYGMAGGKLLIHGRAGSHAGYRMRRGLLAIAEGSGDFTGRSMRAGTIFLGGPCGRLTGAGMKRGTLLLPHVSLQLLPPTFIRACEVQLTVVQLLIASLRQSAFPGPESLGPCEMLLGDQLEGGRGEVFGWTPVVRAGPAARRRA